MNWDALDAAILLPAMIAGLLVLASHVPLGSQVLDRGIVFIDLAIAQIAGLGVIAADAVGLPASGPPAQLAAALAALGGAALLTWSERRMGRHQEALIGVLFVFAASLGVVLLAGNPHGSEHLKDLLVGQVLWVAPADLGWLAAVTVGVLLARRAALRAFGAFGFYALFAIAVTASVQTVGIYLVFSCLIIPALATRGFAQALRPWLGYALGATGFAIGLVLSALFDLPAGAVIVCVLALAGLALSAFGARERAA